jgi:hypothetical protein
MQYEEMEEVVLMALDIHLRTVSNELGTPYLPVSDTDIEDQLTECRKNEDGSYSLEAVSEWMVKYLNESKPELKKMESMVLEKRISKLINE